MVARRPSNTNANKTSTVDRGEEDDDVNGVKKMKSLHQLEDIVVDRQKHGSDEMADDEDNEIQEEEEEEEEDDEDDDENEGGGELRDGAKPIGDVLRVSNEGGQMKKHFSAFEFDGCRFHLEDPVLVTPEEEKAKPSVAIVKDIFETKDGDLMVSGQRFYRPEEAEKERGGTWQRHDPRELFYSCHLDDLPADTIMHRCVIHLLPLPNPVPNRKQHPGFIVRKVYDYVHRRLRDLTDKDCEGSLTRRGMTESA